MNWRGENGYNVEWNHWISYRRDIFTTKLLTICNLNTSDRYSQRININLDNCGIVIETILQHKKTCEDAGQDMSYDCKLLYSNLRKATKEYLHQVVYNERKVNYDEMVLEMAENTPQGNA